MSMATGTTTRTTCPYCGVGCGVIAERAANGSLGVRGDPDHPANLGRLCSKGTALAATLGAGGRLLEASVDGVTTSLDVALDAVAARLKDCITTHGPDSVAFYVSGQLLTEDYYVANKLVKGYIGTANIDTNSRLCMASAVAGHVRAFGEDVVPAEYTDLEQADLVVLVGSNLAWCHPVLMQRILAAREQRPMQLVVIDPRRTATCDGADLHLPLRSGTDVMLFNGLLSWLADNGHVDAPFVAEHTNGVEKALDAARVGSSDIAATAQICGLDASAVERFFTLFAGTRKVVTLFSQGVNQSSAGTDKVNSIINCHLFTGRIGQPGMGPFSITGQPNAMGGREVGGLATQLAAHLALSNPEHRSAVQEFWGSPRIADRPGLRAVELFEAIDAGRVKAVWIMATNPVVSLPDADLVRRALARCPLVIMSDCVSDNDTLPLAHIRLPAAGWAEKDGTVTNSDRHVSRQRAFLPLPGDARPDWWLMTQVGRRMGFGTGFSYDSPAAIFDEFARLTEVSRSFGMQLDLQSLAGLDRSGYEAMPVTQWPTTRGSVARPFANGRFPTADGRARFVATPARMPRHAPGVEFPLILNTGRIRDQWHTMTRTARAPQLNAHEPEPFIDAHAQDLAAAGVAPGELLRVVSRWGSALARARASGDIPPGMVFMPIHWNDQFARGGRIGAVVNPVVDALSGEPEFKHTPVRLEKVVVEWRGFLLTREPVAPPEALWWAASPGDGVTRLEFAGRGASRPGAEWLRSVLPAAAQAEWIEFADAATGHYRAALVQQGRLLACLMVVTRGALPARAWLASLFARDSLDATDRRCLLLGRRHDAPDPGPTVCACHAVGAITITDAVRSGCDSVEAVGRKLRAGTNCGSCRPEIAKLVAAAHTPAAPPLTLAISGP
ncbi:MAG TPA: molybdopterin-dependent oxidoreductase [Steroidobacteraceae bacterium]|nr:molybdopterin-dependent oxidoreductase [Steroidobacteraceae bacterium]